MTFPSAIFITFCLSTPLVLYRDLPLVIVIFPFYFHAFIIAALYTPVLFFPSCSLASFNHPLPLCASRLCGSSEGPESFLIIPQHGSHFHKHAAKNKPFPCQPPHTPEAKNISPRPYRCIALTRVSRISRNVESWALFSGIRPFLWRAL